MEVTLTRQKRGNRAVSNKGLSRGKDLRASQRWGNLLYQPHSLELSGFLLFLSRNSVLTVVLGKTVTPCVSWVSIAMTNDLR